MPFRVLVLTAAALAKLFLLALPLLNLSAIAFHAGAGSLSAFSAWVGLVALVLGAMLFHSAVADAVCIFRLVFGSADAAPVYHGKLLTATPSEFWSRLHIVPELEIAAGPSARAVMVAAILALMLSGKSSSVLMAMGLLFIVISGEVFWRKLPKGIGIVLSLAVLLASAVFFGASSFRHALEYFHALGGYMPLADSALINDGRMSADMHLLQLVIGAVVVGVLPPLQEMLPHLRRWQIGLAGAFVVLFAAWHLPVSGTFMRTFAMNNLLLGSQQVFVGREGWLFDEQELDAITGPGAASNKCTMPDTVIAVAAAFKKRGIPLLLIPIPMKAAMYPEYITGSTPDNSEAPVYHTGEVDIYERFTKAGIEVRDIVSNMMEAKEKRVSLFAKYDSLWSPDIMQTLAKGIAAEIRKTSPGLAAPSPMVVDARAMDAHTGTVPPLFARAGGLAPMMPDESVVILSFPSIANDPASPIGILGGNEVAVYDDPALGYLPASASPNESIRAGFAQHLALYLGKSVDVIKDAKGAAPQPSPDFVAKMPEKKLVIWLLPVRDLLATP